MPELPNRDDLEAFSMEQLRSFSEPGDDDQNAWREIYDVQRVRTCGDALTVEEVARYATLNGELRLNKRLQWSDMLEYETLSIVRHNRDSERRSVMISKAQMRAAPGTRFGGCVGLWW